MTNVQLFPASYGVDARKRLAEVIGQIKGADLFAPVTVVVPTVYAGLLLRRSLSGGTGLVNARFMVLPRLAEYLGSPTMVRQKKAPLSGDMDMAAVRQASVTMLGRGPLGGFAGHPRLHESLRRTFSDMARLPGTTHDALARTDELRSQIVRWYTQYREILKDYYGGEELTAAAAGAVKSGAAASALRDLGFIVFYLAHDLSPAEKSLISALHVQNRCAVIPFERPKASHLLAASDTREEVRWVVRRIMRDAGQGVPFHRMAVLYRQADTYASLVRSQLAFAGVPVAGPDPSPLSETPAGKLLLYLLEILEDFERAAVMRWLCETPVRSGQEGTAVSSELARWDAVSREAGIVGGAAQWQERLDGYVATVQQRIADLEESGDASPGRMAWLQANLASASRLKLFTAELAAVKVPADGSSWKVFSTWAADLLERYSTDPSVWPEEQRPGYERVTSAVEGLSSLDWLEGGTDITKFTGALSNALEAPSGRAGQTGRGVFAAPLGSCQGMEFDVVYIVGMAEGAFPPGIGDDPMLPDSVRLALDVPGALPSADIRRIEERRLFLAAMSSAPEVVLCYAAADPSARRGQYPSPWFLEEASRLHGKRLGTADMDALRGVPWLSRIFSLQHGLSYADTVAPADDRDYDLNSLSGWCGRGRPLEKHYLMEAAQVPGKAVRMEGFRTSGALTEWDGKVPSMSEAGQPGIDGKPVSPTSLEKMATCPFRYFLGYVLKVSTPESPEELLTLSPMERGSLLHKVVELFFKECIVCGISPGYGVAWQPQHESLLLKIAAGQFDQAEARGITGKRVFWEAAKEDMRRDLRAFLDEDSLWRAEQKARPLWTEKAFGMGGRDGLPAVEVNLPGGLRVAFRGLIDRVDECHAGPGEPVKLNVVDYKFGSTYSFKDMKGDALGAGRHLQLPVYALAARLAYARPANVESMYWFATAKEGFERKGVDLAAVETRFGEILAAITAMIKQGLFPSNPGDEHRGNCTFCDFKKVCPPDSDLAWEKKSSAPELASYLGLAPRETTEGEEE